MDSKKFKNRVAEYLQMHSFKKAGNSFYSRRLDLSITVGLQKSNFSNAYYINLGYFLVDISEQLIDYKYEKADIRARFSHRIDGKKVDVFELEHLVDLDESLKENINKYIIPINSSSDLKNLLNAEPTLLYLTTLNAKTKLGINID